MVRFAGNANSTRVGESLKTSRDIHTIPKKVRATHHHIAHMHPYAEAHPALFRNPVVGLCQRPLYLHGTLDRIHDTRELSEHTVARRVGYPAPVLGYEPIHDFPVRC